MLLLALAILGGPTGRRVVRALAAAVAAGLVMYGVLSTGEPPAGDGARAGRPAPAGTAPGPRRPAAKAPVARTPAKAAAAGTPAAVAAQWYAQRKGLPASRVRPLQVDRADPDTLRVLLLVTKRGGGLDSAVVAVRRAGNGWVVRNP
jgi:hypothetical protein